MNVITMKLSKVVSSLTLVSVLALPLAGISQTSAQRHRRAVDAQRASDHAHHTGAKVVVGSAAGGAVVGGLLGGGKGALIGGALGAGGGAVANKVRVNKRVHARERNYPN